MESIVYQYWLMSNTIIPYNKKYKLAEYFTDAYHVYHANRQELLASRLLNAGVVEDLLEQRKRQDIYEEYVAFSRGPYSFVTVEDEAYPQGLRTIFDPPYGLYYTGRLPDFGKAVSIVGARRCSEYGRSMAERLGEEFAARGYTVVSGMARGIDSHSHWGALHGQGLTAAVLGSGLDVIYPRENRRLYTEISEHGAVISEFPMGMQPLPENFPIRNRIVAGLSDILIVVEARLRSGSLITADLALEQGKDIYVVPGRVGDSLSEGCNKLVTQGAGLIYSIDQFFRDLEELGDSGAVEVRPAENISIRLSADELIVYSLLDLYPKSLAEVQLKCQMDYLKLISVVISLVNRGLIREVFKNNYVIVA